MEQGLEVDCGWSLRKQVQPVEYAGARRDGANLPPSSEAGSRVERSTIVRGAARIHRCVRWSQTLLGHTLATSVGRVPR
jgi:hypothetical protein